MFPLSLRVLVCRGCIYQSIGFKEVHVQFSEGRSDTCMLHFILLLAFFSFEFHNLQTRGRDVICSSLSRMGGTTNISCKNATPLNHGQWRVRELENGPKAMWKLGNFVEGPRCANLEVWK